MIPGTQQVEKERTRALFAEALFLLMRERRYGIAACTDMEDPAVLTARYELVHAIENGWEP